jgi:hypothetical protein
MLSLLEDQQDMAHKSMGISHIIHSYYNNDGYVESDDHSPVENYEIEDNEHLYNLLSSMCYDFLDFIQNCTMGYYINNLPLNRNPMLLEIEYDNNELIFKIGAETMHTILIDEEDCSVITENREIVHNFFKCFAYETIKADDKWHHAYSQINDSRIEEFIQKHTHLVYYVFELN